MSAANPGISWRWQNVHFAAAALSVFVVYFCAGWIGIRFAAIGDGSLSLLWLPSGVGLSACLLFGPRIWPAIWLGSFLSNSPYLYEAEASYPLLKMLFFGGAAATVNTLVQSLLAYHLFRRFVEPHGLATKRGIQEFVFRATLIPSIFNIVFLVPLYHLGGYMVIGETGFLQTYLATWFSASLGDFHGYFVVTPFIWSWLIDTGPGRGSRMAWRDFGIYALVFALLVIVGLEVYWQAGFLLIPFGVLVALRFGMRGASMFMLLFPFPSPSPLPRGLAHSVSTVSGFLLLPC